MAWESHSTRALKNETCLTVDTSSIEAARNGKAGISQWRIRLDTSKETPASHYSAVPVVRLLALSMGPEWRAGWSEEARPTFRAVLGPANWSSETSSALEEHTGCFPPPRTSELFDRLSSNGISYVNHRHSAESRLAVPSDS